ncbi:hypothetical protein [Paraburkholderia tuberum]|uniref:hypothetical protein n=1 Tax=Paraburkholderia TaxID=1822464 RepID=UPI0013A6A9CA|nr:hypothetical protein [Paraburkholderia tuberum]
MSGGTVIERVVSSREGTAVTGRFRLRTPWMASLCGDRRRFETTEDIWLITVEVGSYLRNRYSERPPLLNEKWPRAEVIWLIFRKPIEFLYRDFFDYRSRTGPDRPVHASAAAIANQKNLCFIAASTVAGSLRISHPAGLACDYLGDDPRCEFVDAVDQARTVESARFSTKGTIAP